MIAPIRFCPDCAYLSSLESLLAKALSDGDQIQAVTWLRAGAPVGFSLLRYVVENRFSIVLQELIDRKANLEIKNEDAETIFQWLVFQRNAAGLEWLISRIDKRPDLLDDLLEEAIDLLAEAIGCKRMDQPAIEVIQVLIEAGATLKTLFNALSYLHHTLPDSSLAKLALNTPPLSNQDLGCLYTARNQSAHWKEIIDNWIRKSLRSRSVCESLFEINSPVLFRWVLKIYQFSSPERDQPFYSFFSRILKNPRGQEFVIYLRNKNLLKLLIEQQHPLDLQDARGNTFLHYAYQHDFLRGANLLLQYGAQANIPNQQNITPFQMGMQAGRFQNLTPEQLSQLLNKWGMNKILKVVNDLILECGKPLLDSIGSIALPFELLEETLENGSLFQGSPIVVGASKINDIVLPIFAWENAQNSFFQFATEQTAQLFPFLPQKKAFPTYQEMTTVFNHLKQQTPIGYQPDGCTSRAQWFFAVLDGLMRYQILGISLIPANGEKYIFPTYPYPVKRWRLHEAIVVHLNGAENQLWVFDALLDKPIPLDKWHSRFHIKDPAHPPQERLWHTLNTEQAKEWKEKLRHLYLFEKMSTSQSINKFYKFRKILKS